MSSKTPNTDRLSKTDLLKKLEAGQAFVKKHSETFKVLGAAVGGLVARAMKRRVEKRAQTRFEHGMEQPPPEADPLP